MAYPLWRGQLQLASITPHIPIAWRLYLKVHGRFVERTKKFERQKFFSFIKIFFSKALLTGLLLLVGVVYAIPIGITCEECAPGFYCKPGACGFQGMDIGCNPASDYRPCVVLAGKGRSPKPHGGA
ncbi:hypothetical protein IAQ61_000013 [Plenodomus lingam]|uniref:uncharacterized protein n=1 Tax=Leptosphaeria maculans TaxID=5022 RepID=UPI0033178CC5|nr:hypothetical protein IAQ61_000013 [Plenodomus lingam]